MIICLTLLSDQPQNSKSKCCNYMQPVLGDDPEMLILFPKGGRKLHLASTLTRN